MLCYDCKCCYSVSFTEVLPTIPAFLQPSSFMPSVGQCCNVFKLWSDICSVQGSFMIVIPIFPYAALFHEAKKKTATIVCWYPARTPDSDGRKMRGVICCHCSTHPHPSHRQCGLLINFASNITRKFTSTGTVQA